jgi:hypothetical protein
MSSSGPFSWNIIKSILARFSTQAAAGKTPVADGSGKIADEWIDFPELPAASAASRGGIKVGSGLSISGDVLSTNSNIVQGLNISSVRCLGTNFVNNESPYTLPAGGTWLILAYSGSEGGDYHHVRTATGVFPGGTTITDPANQLTTQRSNPHADGFYPATWGGHAVRIS